MFSIKAIEVRLDVEDVPRSAGFYANMLGFEMIRCGRTMPQIRDSPSRRPTPPAGKECQRSTSAQRAPCTLWLDVAGIGELYAALQEKVGLNGDRRDSTTDASLRSRPGRALGDSFEVTDDPPTCEAE